MNFETEIKKLQEAIYTADMILIGAGAGLSTAAGLTYSGERFHRLFGDFEKKYGITDIYTGGFFPFPSEEERWAWWSRHIWYNRYTDAPKPVYQQLLSLVKGKDYFVLTTNVDHQFQRAGFEKQRLFYTQGDYGLLQCTKPCCQKTWDNEDQVREMVEKQKDMRIPTELIPHCPNCGRLMTTNLRSDDKFVEDEGWHEAAQRYKAFTEKARGKKLLLLELGVGMNTPGIIKIPFLKMAMNDDNATYACIGIDDVWIPDEIKDRSIGIAADIADVISLLMDASSLEKQPGRKERSSHDT